MRSRSRMRPAVAAVAAVLTIAMGDRAPAAATPAGVHVSFGADPTTSLTVAWHTAGLDDVGARVEYGPTEALGRTANGSSRQATGVETMLHEAALAGLEPGAPVYYRACGDDACSRVFVTRTAPVDATAFRFTAFGDHGQKPTSQAATAAVLADAPAFHLIAGDLSYANQNLALWDPWFEQVEPLASTVPLMPAPGNHETDSGQSADPNVFADRFALPGDELWYSFDYGRVHFLIVHSTYLAAARQALLHEQVAFVERDLAEAGRRKREGALDFIVVVQHHPLYASQDSDSGAYTERRYNPPLIAWEERLFHAHGVDVLVAAHNHYYERTSPLAYNLRTADGRTSYRDPIGFIEVITGGGGQSLYEFVDPADAEPWSLVRLERYHYVRFDVNGRTLTATAISTADPPGEILDTWTLTRA